MPLCTRCGKDKEYDSPLCFSCGHKRVGKKLFEIRSSRAQANRVLRTNNPVMRAKKGMNSLLDQFFNRKDVS